MIRRDGYDPMQFTISRGGKKLNSLNAINANTQNYVPNPITGWPASEVVCLQLYEAIFSNYISINA